MKDENNNLASDNNDEIIDVEIEETDDNGEVTLKKKLNTLKQKCEKLEQEKKEYLDGWLRSQADYKNLLKEMDIVREKSKNQGMKKVIEELLPSLDAYDMARANKESWEQVDKNWRLGIEYIFNMFEKGLGNFGVTSFGNVGEVIDPLKYEATELVDTDDQSLDQKVSVLLNKGYVFGGEVIRPAKVKVWNYKQ